MLLEADAFPSSLLAVMAHPDDVDFGAAGTIARFTAAGTAVTYAIVTSGEAGEVPGVPRDEVAALRQSEQRAAAAAVGVTDVRFLGFPDGMVEAGLALRRAITRVIRQVRPQVVLTMNPERDYVRIGRGHPDHRATGAAAMDAVFPDSRNPTSFTELLDNEGLEPHVVEQLWFSGPNPDTWNRHHRNVREEGRRPAGPPVPDRPLRRPARHAAHLADRERGRGRAGPGPPRRGVPGRPHGLIPLRRALDPAGG